MFLCSPQAKPFLEAFGPGVIGPARAVEDGGASSNVEGMDAVATTAASETLTFFRRGGEGFSAHGTTYLTGAAGGDTGQADPTAPKSQSTIRKKI